VLDEGAKVGSFTSIQRMMSRPMVAVRETTINRMKGHANGVAIICSWSTNSIPQEYSKLEVSPSHGSLYLWDGIRIYNAGTGWSGCRRR